ncbi:MAG: PQQ-binding-like beta-propeller repeat protein [Pirellulaceae bacterium]|nr:PQQ-binding-like beta-propeller repeat protein [Pirellulaceae bacterium]
MTAADLLNDLERQELVSAEIIASLRRQVTSAAKPVALQTVIKLLVDKGHLTPAQGQKFLGPPATGATAVAAPVAPKTPTKPKSLPVAKPTSPAKATPALVAAPAAEPLADLGPVADLAPIDDLQPLDGLPPLNAAGEPDLLGSGDLLAGGDPFASPMAAADPLASASLPAAAPAALAQSAAPVAAGPKTGLWIALALVGVLVVAGIGAGALFLIPRPTGEQEFALAEQDYQAQQYAAATEKFTALLARFPNHPQAGTARVHRGMAQLMAANPGAKNWAAVLPVAKQSLPEIAADPGMTELHSQLAPLVQEMALALVAEARQAKSAGDQEALAAQAAEALALASDARLVPAALRQWQELDVAEESLAIVQRDLARDRRLADAGAAISGAISAGQFDAALAERGKLLASYPELASREELATWGRQLSAAMIAATKSAPQTTAAETSESAPEIVGCVTFVCRRPPLVEATTPAGPPLFLAAGGSAWGLDGASGKVLWRRGGVKLSPVPIAAGSASDALLIGDSRHELLRVAGQTGSLKWRHSLRAAAAGVPVGVGDQIIVATRGGELLALDANTGAARRKIELNQPLRVPPVADPAGKWLYVVADRLTFAVLGAADLSPLGGGYLGHEPGSMLAPLVLFGNRLIMAENRGLETGVLHVLTLGESGLPTGTPQQISYAGQVLTAPIVAGDRLIVLTDRGRALVLAPGSDAAAPLRKLDESQGTNSAPLIRFGVFHSGQIWLADRGLRRYNFQPATGKLAESWQGLGGDLAAGPPQVAGGQVISLRHAGAGSIVTAVEPATGAIRWETRLALPLAAPVVAADADGAARVAGEGGLIARVDLASATGPAIREYPPTAKPLPKLAAALPRGARDWVLFPQSAAGEVWLASEDAAAPSAPLPGPIAGDPLALAGGLLIPCASGAICWFGPEASAVPIPVFQLRGEPGSRWTHCSLAATGAASLALSDGRGQVLHVELKLTPQPHLVATASARLDSPPASPLAVLGQFLYLVDQGGSLRSLALSDLAVGKSWDIAGAEFGPCPLGDCLLVATGGGELLCLDANQGERWKVPLKDGLPTGCRAEGSGSILVAFREGVVLHLASNSGQELARIDLAQPLAGAPQRIGQQLLVPAADGSLLLVSPTKGGTP